MIPGHPGNRNRCDCRFTMSRIARQTARSVDLVAAGQLQTVESSSGGLSGIDPNVEQPRWSDVAGVLRSVDLGVATLDSDIGRLERLESMFENRLEPVVPVPLDCSSILGLENRKHPCRQLDHVTRVRNVGGQPRTPKPWWPSRR